MKLQGRSIDVVHVYRDISMVKAALNRLSPVAANSRQIVVYSYQGILGDMTTNHGKIIPI